MPGLRSHYGKRSKDREARELKQHMNVGAAGGGGGVTDHGALTGLADDDHANYMHLTAARTVLAQHSFSPSSAQAPFLLGANAQGQVVTGLRADQLNKDVIAGNALTGGGTLTGDVTLNVAPGAGMKILSDAIAVDFAKDEDWDDMADAYLDWNTITHGLDVNLSGYDFSGEDFGFLAGLGLIWSTDQIDVNPGTALEISGDQIIHSTGDNGDLHTNYPEHDQTETISGSWKFTAAIEIETNSYPQLLIDSASHAELHIDGAVATFRGIRYYTSGSERWTFGVSNDAESGSNVGSDWTIYRYTDVGGYIDRPILIRRSTGEVELSHDLQLDANLDFVGPQSITTSSGDLSILPADDLIITPGSGITKMTDELQFQGAGEISTTSGDLTLSPTGDLDLAPTGSLLFSTSLIPTLTDTYDIGSSVKLWRTGYFSELQSLLFVENTIQVTGGWQIIAYNQGTAQEDIDGSETAIDLGIDETGTNGLAANDFILFRGYGNVEYMQIVSQSGGLGSTIWNVTRNVDLSGANTWPQGSVFAVLGYNGDGRIELVASQNDSPRISLFTQGTSYNTQSEFFRFGNLRDSYSIGSADTYGFGVGDYATQSYIQVTAAEGIEFYDDASVRVGQLKGEVWTIGQVDASHKHIELTGDSIQFIENDITYASLSGSKWTIGLTTAENVQIDASGIVFDDNGTTVGSLSSSAWTLGQTGAGGDYLTVSTSGIEMFGNNTKIVDISNTGVIILGEVGVGYENILIESSGIKFRVNETVRGSLNGTTWTLGDVASERVIVTTSAVQFQDDSNVVRAQLTGTDLTLGLTSQEHIKITATEVNFMNSTTVVGSLAADVWTLGAASSEQLKVTATKVEMLTATSKSILKLEGSTITIGDWNAANNEYMVVNTSGIEMYSNGILTVDINTTAGVTVGPAATDHVTITSTGIKLVDNTTVRADFQTDGDIFIGTNTGATATTFFRIFGVASGMYGIGDLVIGSYAAGNGNIWWDDSASKLHFRIAEATSELYINSTGQMAFGTDSVFLDSDGITLEASTSFASGSDNEISWYDAPISNNQISAGIDVSSNRGTVTTTSHRRMKMWVNLANSETEAATITISSVYNIDTRISLGGAYLEDIHLSSSNAVFINEGASLYIGDTSNAEQSVGLTIKTGSTLDEAISLKSSSVAHGMTTVSETDTWLAITKYAAATGGADILAMCDATDNLGISLTLRGISNTQYTGKGTTSTGVVMIQGMKRNGTTVQALATDGNVFVVRTYLDAAMIVDQEGGIFCNTSIQNTDHWGHVTGYDDHDDIALLHGLRASTVSNKTELYKNFSKFIDYARPILEGTKIVHYNDGPGEDGRPYVDLRGLAFLTIDAVRQFYDKQMAINENVHEELRRVYAKMHLYEGALLELGTDPKLLEG